MSKARDTVETLRTVLVDGDVTNANFTGADLEVGKGGTGASSAGAARTALGLAIGTDVLAPDGSAANLTNLPAGGAEDFVASGTLPNGKPVILKANGQVEVVSASNIAESIPAGSEVVLRSSGISNIAMAFDPNTANKFVISYQDGNNSDYGTAIVGTVSGTSISFGTAALFNSGSTTVTAIAFDPNTANKFVVAYRDNSNSYYGTATVGTISGTSISFGTAAVFNTASTGVNTISFDPNAANKFVIGYRDNGNSGYGTTIVGTVSGTSISFSAETQFNTSGTTDYISLSFDPNTANKFVVVYKNGGNSNYGTAKVGTLSGTSTSYGSAVVFNAGQVSDNSVSFDPNNANKLVVAYRDFGNSSYGTAIIGTVSGTSISFGSEYVFNSAQTNDLKCSFGIGTGSKFVATYMDTASASNDGTCSVGTVSGTSISYGSKSVYNTGQTNSNLIAFDPNNAGKFVIYYSDGGNSYAMTVIVGQVATPITTNLTSTNFLGTATAAYTNGQTASIMLKGGISDNQTSLTAGSTYYVQPAGTFATSAGTPSVLAGEAVSATSLLLNGLATPDEIPSQSGNTGKFLTTNGSAASWGTVAAGLVHISTVTANGVSVAEFTTGLSSYESFIIVCTGFYPATNTADIYFTFNNNSSNYTGIMGGVNDSGASYAIERGSEMALSYNQNSTAANADLTSAQINIFGNASGEYKNVVGISGYRSNNYGQMSMNISGGWRDTAAITSIQIWPNSGNFYGKFMLYGVTTS